MGNVLVQESSLQDIADAIRLKNGSQTLYKPAEMSDAIEAISGGGITPSGTKSITANGTGIDVASYAYADVDVPNTYAAGDEGKVVSSGALVSQTSDTVTANNTYDTTLISSLTVNVSNENNSSFQLKDFKIPSQKWVIQSSIPNLVDSGGCIHLIITVPESPIVSADSGIIAFGADALSAWSSSTNCFAMLNMYNSGDAGSNKNQAQFRLRGSTLNGWFPLYLYEDANRKIDIKFYKTKFINVNTNTTYNYSDSSSYTNLGTCMANLCNNSYISIGQNYYTTTWGSNVLSLFAVESS